MLIKIILLLAFVTVMVTIGIISKKQTGSVSGFVLGGRKAGPWLTAFAYGTSYFSAVVFVGYAGQFGWKYGISATWIGIGNAFIGSLAAWLLLGNRTHLMTKHLSATTMPEFFEKRYGNKLLRTAASIITFVFLIPYTASVYNGLSRLFGMAFNIPYSVCVISMAVLTGVYVILGGYMATAINDLIQGIIMIGGIVAVVINVLNGKGGFLAAFHELSKVEIPASQAAATTGVLTSLFGPDPIGLLSVVILTSLGTWGLPQMIHKFYAIKDSRSIKAGTVISTVFAVIVSCSCYFLGGFGRIFDCPEIHAADGSVIFDAIVPTMLSSLSDLLISIVIVLVLSASMSTLSSLVLTSASTLTLDFIKPCFNKSKSFGREVLWLRVSSAFFVILSVIIALRPSAFIAQLMGISWGALAGAFLAPFLYGLYLKKTSVVAVWSSFIFGVGLTIINLFTGIIGSPVVAGAVSMIGGLIIVPLVSLFTKSPDQSVVDNAFAGLSNSTDLQNYLDNESSKEKIA